MSVDDWNIKGESAQHKQLLSCQAFLYTVDDPHKIPHIRAIIFYCKTGATRVNVDFGYFYPSICTKMDQR